MREALCQELFLYVGLETRGGVPLLEPRIFTLSSVSERFDTICVHGADIFTDPQFPTRQETHHLRY
jgi:hypothetical protein